MRWFRIHSLPNSKRYPDNEQEVQIILDRQRSLLNNLIDSNDEIYGLIGYFNYELETTQTLQTEIGEFIKFKTIDLFSSGQELSYGPYSQGDLYETYLQKCSWNFEWIEPILRKIMHDDYSYRFSICNKSQQRLFVPYGGGMDVIMESEAAKEEQRAIYKEWLSERRDGY